MNRYIIGSLWDRINRNGTNKNFEYLFEGRQKIDELNYRAEGILTEAKKTNDMNKNVQEQINTLIAESGTSDAEVLQARIDSEGKTHSVLKERLDTDLGKKSNITDVNGKIANVNDSIKKIANIINGLKTEEEDPLFDNAPLINNITSLANGKKIKLPAGEYPVYNEIIVRSGMIFEGNGMRETKLIQKANKSVFKAQYVNENLRTQQFTLKEFTVIPRKGNTEPVFNLNGSSYFEMDNVECVTDSSYSEYNNDGIVFNVTTYFNGYIKFNNVRIIGFRNNLKGSGNQIKIEGGMYNRASEYNINIYKSAGVVLDYPEISHGGKGGAYLDANGINVYGFWTEYNGSRIEGQYNPNNFEISEDSKYVNVSTGRFDVSNGGVVHGDNEDYGVDYSQYGISNGHNSTYGLINNGNFKHLFDHNVPMGWVIQGSPDFSVIDDVPKGHGGISLKASAGAPKMYQILIPKEDIKMYIGRTVSMHFYVRYNGISSYVRSGIGNTGAGALNSGSYINLVNTKNKWIKYTAKYKITGNEASDITGGIEVVTNGLTTIDIAGVSARIGDLNFDTPEIPITGAGGNIYTQEFKIGGKRHGHGTEQPDKFELHWNVGDIVWNTEPKPGGFIGWVCVTRWSDQRAWQPFGAIEGGV